MKIHIATTLVVVLALTNRAEAIFCLFWLLFVPNACRWGVGGGGGGGGAPSPPPTAPPPPPPPNCGPGTYRWGNGCRNAIGTCPNLPNNQVFAHPKYPCGCQVPNSPFDADAQICSVAPPNGKAFCETYATGQGSKCGIQCDPGYTFNPNTVKCIRGSLDGCPAPKQLAAGGLNKGCICLNPSDPAVSALGTKCGTVPYFDPDDATAGLPPPGRRRCIVPPEDVSNSKCVTECDPGYKPHPLQNFEEEARKQGGAKKACAFTSSSHYPPLCLVSNTHYKLQLIPTSSATMRSILPALSLLALLLPTALCADPVVVQNECEPPLKLAAFPTKTCECQHDNSIRADNGVGCAASAPPNSNVTCLSVGMTAHLCIVNSSGPKVSFPDQPAFGMRCEFACKQGFSKEGGQCVSGGGGTAELAAACPAPFVVSYASASGPCGCAANINMARKRRPDAVQCQPPNANGNVGCRNVGTGSKCSVDCDDGYKPSADETQCVPERANVTISELDCGADAGSVGFLTADPVEGCVCKPTRTENFCGVAVGDPDAEMSCTDTTHSNGTREVKCAVQCTAPAFVANAENKCEEAEAESSTIAGTGTPRDSFETRCTEKVFRLPGKAGCKCAASPPEGGQECRGAGDNEYVICRYRKGSGRPAACSKNCVQGTYPDENNQCN
ncbi:hypothetical protein C8F04DRAFT_1266588 [Mycena alexandri]|uniref:Uncharacterized protein n=1 Tax=Mycena alexandri TaxID=1745969 RepID=A0AAD6WWG7_9AGAR|nr:hypothetical protein C8F04DRAFT_1266588 [Mycena alexandri]